MDFVTSSGEPDLSDVQGQAFADGLKVFETVAAGCTAACESGQACGMPSACVDVMLCIFSSGTQPHEHRLQAGRVTASLLNSHKCQRTALRCDVSLDSAPRISPHLKCMPCSQAQQVHLQDHDAVHMVYGITARIIAAGRGADLIAWQHRWEPARRTRRLYIYLLRSCHEQ